MAARKRKTGGGNGITLPKTKKLNPHSTENKKDLTHSGVTKQKPAQKTSTVSNEWLKKNRSTPSKGTYGTRTGVNKLK